ncbi:MAG: flagellar basal body-associated FliL family protein, partial [Deltaproteobacteria bacterium]
LALDPFIVNLQDNSGTRYLKLTLSFELDGGPDEIAAQTVKVRDSLIVLLSSKSYADIGTVEGKYQMRDEIVVRVNQFLTKTKVKSVYFSDFVIQ